MTREPPPPGYYKYYPHNSSIPQYVAVTSSTMVFALRFDHEQERQWGYRTKLGYLGQTGCPVDGALEPDINRAAALNFQEPRSPSDEEDWVWWFKWLFFGAAFFFATAALVTTVYSLKLGIR